MKQLKFLKTISCEGKPVWYKDCCYEVVSEGANAQGREMYKLFCEDLKLRGIDISLADNFYKVIEIKLEENKKEDITIPQNDISDVLIKEEVEKEQKEMIVQKPKPSSNKKKKSSKN